MKIRSLTILERQSDGAGRSSWVLGEGAGRALGLLTWSIWFACVPIRLWTTAGQVAASGVPPDTLVVYLASIHNFWAGAPVYFADNLHGFHYLPIMVILATPLTWIDIVAAGAIFGLVSAAFLTWSVVYLARSIDPKHAFVCAGTILAVGSMSAIVTLTYLNSQMIMTAAMIAAAAAGMKGRWREMALWLVLAMAIKPLALVMVLLTGLAVPRTRLIFAGAIAVLLAMPFAFRDWHYLSGEYVNYVRQLWHITAAPPGQWFYQADFSTLLSHMGLDLGAGLRLTIRLAAAGVCVVLALRMAATGGARAMALAFLLLSACYIGLFNPRQEQFSFMVVVPSVTAVGLLFLARNIVDWRGWAWIALALLVGAQWGDLGRWLLPAFMVPIWAGLLVLMFNRARWRALVMGDPAPAPVQPAA